MTDVDADPRAPARSLRKDLYWTLWALGVLTFLARLAESPALGGAAVSWAAPASMALLATVPRARRASLALAGIAAIGAGLWAGGDTPTVALVRAAAYGVEGLIGARLAARRLGRSNGARTPLAFATLLAAVTLLPPLAGASLATLLHAPAGTQPELAPATRWLATYSADSFATIALFPLALALRLHPPERSQRRAAAITLLLTLLVVVVTVLSVIEMARPFAFCSLVLGVAALVAGPRTRVLAVWACLAAAVCVIGHVTEPPGGFSLSWVEIDLFLPGMAIALPIQVLSVALKRLHQANTVLQASRERFRRLYDNAPVMLQSVDAGGRTTEVNAQWLATLGYDSADAVRGTPFEHFVVPEAASEAEAVDPPDTRWHRRLLAAQGTKLHLRLRTAGGRAIPTLASAASTPDAAQSAGDVVLAFEDISVELAMRAELEHERDRLAALTSATTDVAFFIDRELRYRSVNRAFERCWRTTREAVLGLRPAEVAGQASFASELAAPLARALAGEASRFQADVALPGGVRVMEIALAPAHDAAGARAGVVATMHDVTERVEAAQALRQLVADLRHANEGLQQFARLAAHDLREPLNTIAQFGALIEEDYADRLEPEARRWFELMRTASLRMTEMLDDVLHFVRLERAPAAPREAVPLERVFADLRALLPASPARGSAILVVEPGLPAVAGPPALVELLFRKLLANALRYTAPGIEPRVEVSTERMGELVVVTIVDNGVAIPPSQLEHLFTPFHRLPGHQAEGSGLALAICRRIAIVLGGRIWAEPNGTTGSRLRVALPLATERARAASPP